MDNKEACKIFNSSISSTEAEATLQAKALALISFSNKFLFFSDSFFESSRPSILNSLLNITAAETTGPAKGPLPASSTPASINLKALLLLLQLLQTLLPLKIRGST